MSPLDDSLDVTLLQGGDEEVVLSHGTTQEGLAGIKGTGFNAGKVFLTSRREVAESYAPEVVEVTVKLADLRKDFDTEDPSVENQEMSIREWVESGKSVFIESANIIAVDGSPVGPMVVRS